jgi:hypothetical protein
LVARAELGDEEPGGSAQPALAGERSTDEAASTSQEEKDLAKEISVGEHVRSRGVFLCF